MSVQLWKVLVPALGLSLLWTACKKEQSATQTEEQQSNEPRYSGTVEDDPAMVSKASLLVSADFINTVHMTARKGGGGKPGTQPVDTTTTTPPPPTDTTTITPPPPADTTVIAPTPAPLPSSYSIMMPSVRYQGTEGSCVAFAVAYARSAEQYYKTGATSYNDAVNVFSPEYIFNQAKTIADCSGSGVMRSMELLKSQGVCTWQSMPYSASNGCSLMPTAAQLAEAANYKISSYSMIVDEDINAIKTMIASNHPVIASFTIDHGFYNAYPGFIWNTLTGNSGGHTMAICGYDDAKHAYKAINSWATNWGDAGYIWIDYDFFPVAAAYYTYVMTL
ncbi:MAG TPA: C1 family peptidase [Niastella sp.]